MSRGMLAYRCRRCGVEYVRFDVPDLASAMVSLVTIGRVADHEMPITSRDIHRCGEGRWGVADWVGGDGHDTEADAGAAGMVETAAPPDPY